MRIARHFKEGDGNSASIPKFMAWRQAHVFDSIAAYDFAGTGDRPSQVKAIHVSQQYFRVFGTNPIAGRAFSEQEDRPGGPRVAIVSYELWTSEFGGALTTIGGRQPRSVQLELLRANLQLPARNSPISESMVSRSRRQP